MTAQVLIIGTVWAEKNATAAGVRMWRLIDALRAAGHEVHFGSANSNGTCRRAHPCAARG